MDPDANLKEQRSIAAKVMQIMDNAHPETGDFTETQRTHLERHALRLAELVQALDQWIKGGGFLPAAWRPNDPGLRIEIRAAGTTTTADVTALARRLHAELEPNAYSVAALVGSQPSTRR